MYNVCQLCATVCLWDTETGGKVILLEESKLQWGETEAEITSLLIACAIVQRLLNIFFHQRWQNRTYENWKKKKKQEAFLEKTCRMTFRRQVETHTAMKRGRSHKWYSLGGLWPGYLFLTRTRQVQTGGDWSNMWKSGSWVCMWVSTLGMWEIAKGEDLI